MAAEPETEWKQPGQAQTSDPNRVIGGLRQEIAAAREELRTMEATCDVLIRTIAFLSDMVVNTMDRDER